MGFPTGCLEGRGRERKQVIKGNCRSMAHSVLVKGIQLFLGRARLSREPWRLESLRTAGGRESAAKKLRSGKKGDPRSRKASSGSARAPVRRPRGAPPGLRASAPSTPERQRPWARASEALARPRAGDNRLLERPAIRRGGPG